MYSPLIYYIDRDGLETILRTGRNNKSCYQINTIIYDNNNIFYSLKININIKLLLIFKYNVSPNHKTHQ